MEQLDLFCIIFILRGVVRNFHPWVPKLCHHQFGYLDCYIRKYFTCTDPSIPQNPWVPFHTFQKSVGSVEPTEPTLTTPLRLSTVDFFKLDRGDSLFEARIS